MVVAATFRALMQGGFCCQSNFKLISLNPFYTPINKEQRVEIRRKEWNIWLASTADDLDLVADWLFFWNTYQGDRGGFEDNLTYYLFIFCILGSVTWSLELIQLSCVRPEFTWTWLSIFILLVEDIPQLVLTLLIQDRFSNLSNYGLFNIMTSLYSVGIRLAGEMFMNCCYCCEKVEEDEEEKDNYKLSQA